MRFLILILIFIATTASAQYTDRYWVFGDSAGIDFKIPSNPQPANSILRVRGTCASICDSAGDLVFYCGSPNWQQWLAPNTIYTDGTVINKNHEVVESGDSLSTSGWYQEMAIVPMPGNDSLFYVFCAGVTSATNGFFYSIVDVKYNNDQGRVIQKNVQLRNDTLADCVSVVRHGNGRDWWVFVRTVSAYTARNDITGYLVTPNGVFAQNTQYVGPAVLYSSFKRTKFNIDGSHIYLVDPIGYIERFDFDRCTGLFSNRTIYSTINGPYLRFWDFEISPDETKLYAVRTMEGPQQDSSILMQFELDTSTFISSAQVLGLYKEPDRGGALKLGPDGKIYYSMSAAIPDPCYDYLYCYSTVNTTNSNLSVINYPDSAYPACDYQPFSFYLGGHKSYHGLPNNPHYEMDTLHGSPCDTLTAVGLLEPSPVQHTLNLYYDKGWQTVFINAEELKGRKATLQFFNTNGQLIESLQSGVDGGYFTHSASFASQPDGVYIIRLQTEKEVLTGKFVKW
jgi:hypothetical protein